MQQPLVTVVTITYNAAEYVRDAIESVLAQSYKNIEYIIGDDCSTDKTWSIVQEYQDPRIKAYRNDQNLKEYPNRNKAIDLATGKYLIFIDGDDLIFPHGVDFFVKMMETFPQAGMAIQKGYYNNLLFPALFSPEETLRNHFYGKNDLLSSSFASDFFRTDLLKQFKLRNDLYTGDDEIRLRIAVRHPILFVAGWVSWPRETPGQASAKIATDLAMEEAYRHSMEALGEAPAELNADLLADMRLTMKKRLARLALHLVRTGKTQRAKKMLSNTGFAWKEVVRYFNYISLYADPLMEFNSSNPLKKGFLDKPFR